MRTMTLALVFAALACGSETDTVDVDPVGAPDCASAKTEGRLVLEKYCAKCHQAPANKAGFDYILDTEAVVNSGKIVPGVPGASPLYKRIKNNIMPPEGVTPRPTAEDKEAVRVWIECMG